MPGPRLGPLDPVLGHRADHGTPTPGMVIPGVIPTAYGVAAASWGGWTAHADAVPMDDDEYTSCGTMTTWTVPSGVTAAIFMVWGAAGAGNSAGTGQGGYVRARFAVSAGQVYNLYNGCQGVTPAGGWPNGGQGGTANNNGRGGGGATYIILSTDDTGAGITTGAKIVAGGGGGASDNFNNVGRGGHGGYPTGGNPTTGSCTGGTSTTGGTGSNENGDVDGVGFGGDGAASGAAAVAEGGGGGGGHHGGGGSKNGVGQGGGGGGSGVVGTGGTGIDSADGVRLGNGKIIIVALSA